MFDGAPADQFHPQLIAARTTLPLHLSTSFHASPTPTTFIPFDPYNPSSHHQLLQHNLFHPILHLKDEQDQKEASSINMESTGERDDELIHSSNWSNDEVLALLRIRSSMESWFPDLTNWDHVSRKLAELGFNKSADKCREKFEDESRYLNSNINYAKNYRFLSELEELYQGDHNNNNNNQNPDDHDHDVVAEKTHHHMNMMMEEDSINKQLCEESEKKAAAEESNRKRKRKRKKRARFEMFKGFCESIVNKMMAQQEEIHRKLMEDMMRRDEEKLAREEAWKKQEMERMNKELELMAQEQAIAGDRQATIIEFLKKCASSSTTSHTLATKDPSGMLHSQNPNNSNSNSTGENNNSGSPVAGDTLLQVGSCCSNSDNNNPAESNAIGDDVGRRWPRDEVLALINLRCKSLKSSEKEKDNKGPLWERISQGMWELGYKRSGKRCKEKWENINKYFRKTKHVNKKRSIDSRTCPYFHQLTNLYTHGKLIPHTTLINAPSGILHHHDHLGDPLPPFNFD